MARIRSIKPEFPQSETMGHLSRDARLLFIQLWTIVDDAGRARAASRMLASLLYPYDDDAPKLIEAWLSELETSGCIRRYEVDGSKYLDVPNWLKHQKIDRPSPSRLPEYREDASNPREPSRALDADLGPRTSTKDQEESRAARSRVNEWPSNYKEAFWSECPKKVDKQATFRKLERIYRADNVSWPVLIAAMRQYAVSVKGTELKYIKSPEVWLNKGCWEDELPAGQTIFAGGTERLSETHIHIRRDSPEWPAFAERWRQERGKDPPIDRDNGWSFPKDYESARRSIHQEAAE